MPKARIPSYSRDPRTNRGFVRWTDSKSGKRRVKVFPGDHGSPESRGAYRIWLNQQHGRSDAARIRDEHRRLQDISVAELMELWIADYARRFGERHQNTHGARYAALAACEDFAAMLVRDFAAGDLAAIRDTLNASGRYSRGEVNRRTYAIRRAFKWGRERSLVPAAVVADLECVAGIRLGEGRENGDPQTADPASVEAIIEALEDTNPNAARIVSFIRWTGCRPSEACRACVGWIDRPSARLVLPPDLSKTRRARIIALNPRAIEIADASIAAHGSIDPAAPVFLNTKGRPYTSSGILQAMRKTADRIGVPRQTPYALRRLAATEVLYETGSEAAAAALLGHSTRSRIVERYTRNRAGLADQAAVHIGGAGQHRQWGSPA